MNRLFTLLKALRSIHTVRVLLLVFILGYLVDACLILCKASYTDLQIAIRFRRLIPLIVIVIYTYLYGEIDYLEYLKLIGFRRPQVKWILLPLAIPLGLYVLSIVYAIFLKWPVRLPGETIAEIYVEHNMTLFVDPSTLTLIIMLSALIVGLTLYAFLSMAEETLWRGYLLKEILEGRSIVCKGLVTGMLQCLWYLPLVVFSRYIYTFINPWMRILLYSSIVLILAPILVYVKERSGSLYSVAVITGLIDSLSKVMMYTIPVSEELAAPYGVLGIASIITIVVLFVVIHMTEKV